MRILPLSVHVANQIAAGEVIERPASVIKELFENALDAGASAIDIEIGFGGLNQIKVSDNGIGIVAEDLPLAIAPHATSKLQVLDDLFHIQSMGFRGEALASIASIARLSIQSRAADASVAQGLVCDEEGIRLVPCARSQGTTVVVRDLFFNAPVRKKFLKSERQEYQAIESVVKRLACCHPTVALTLAHNGKSMLQLPASLSDKTQRVRLTKLLGKSFVDAAVFVDITRGDLRVHGWLSGASYTRSQQDKLWVYINQRMVRDKLILHALRQAYADILPEGRYPACVLFLEMPQDALDINVHPSKYEVRLLDPRAVHDLIHLAVMEVRRHVAVTSPGSQQAPALGPMPQGLSSEPVFNAPPMSEATHAWTVLNAAFALLKHQGQSHLIHVGRLQQAARQFELAQSVFPWDARPLLLPIRVDMPVHASEKFETWRTTLEQMGFAFEKVTENSVGIAAIPSGLPALEIKQFFDAFFRVFDGDEAALIRLLVVSEPVNLQAMPRDMQETLIAFWLESKALAANTSVCLDLAACERALHDA